MIPEVRRLPCLPAATLRHVSSNSLLLLETEGHECPQQSCGYQRRSLGRDWRVLACPIAGSVPLCAAGAGSAAGLRRQGLHEKPSLVQPPGPCGGHAMSRSTWGTQHGGATTRAAWCCQGTKRGAKVTLPGPLGKAWGPVLEHANGWLTTSSPVEDFGAKKTWTVCDGA